MKPVSRTTARRIKSVAAALPLILVAVADRANAAACSFEPQGEGHVAAVIDARSFRLEDGREVRLAGIEPVATDKPANRTAALSAIVAGREVTLRGQDDAPDRYGRQPAFVFLDGGGTSVQSQLLEQGDALVSSSVTDKECALSLTTAEAVARQARRGTWANPAAIKATESPGDILAMIGQFTIVEARFCRYGRRGQRLT